MNFQFCGRFKLRGHMALSEFQAHWYALVCILHAAQKAAWEDRVTLKLKLMNLFFVFTAIRH